MKDYRYVRIKINDPDKFLDKLWQDEDGTMRVKIEEGDLPPVPPTFSYIVEKES